MGYIYKIINNQNDKIYIGKTIVDIRKRFAQHIYEAKNPNVKGYNFILHKAMRKYGFENFSIYEIEKVENDKLNDREIYWIDYYNSMIPVGYNMTFGGEGSIKIDYQRAYALWNEGKSTPEISKILNCTTSQLRQVLSTYDNYSADENNKRILLLHSKSVGQYDKNTGELIKTYKSIKEAAQSVGVDRSCISRCCSGQKKSAKGYVWKFIENTLVDAIATSKINLDKDLKGEKNEHIIKWIEGKY